MAEEIIVNVKPFFLGWGYPDGFNRLDSQELLVYFGNKSYHIEIITSANHQEAHLAGSENNPRGCYLCGLPMGQFMQPSLEDDLVVKTEKSRQWENKLGDVVVISGAVVILVDLPELTIEDAESTVANFVRIQYPSAIPKILWPDNFKENELRSWKETQQQRLNWLKNGAPPFATLIASDVFGSDSKELSREFFEINGFIKRADGSLYKPSEKVQDNIFAILAKKKILEVARLNGETGIVWISPGSWPPIGTVLAGGMLYHIKLEGSRGQRYWVGYLQKKKLLVYLNAENGIFDSLQLSGEPDFLEAMTLIYAPC